MCHVAWAGGDTGKSLRYNDTDVFYIFHIDPFEKIDLTASDDRVVYADLSKELDTASG